MFRDSLNTLDSSLLQLGGGTSGESLMQSYLNSCTQRDLSRCWGKHDILGHIQDHKRSWAFSSQGDQLKSFVLYHQVNSVVEILFLETNPEFFRQGCMRSLLTNMFEHFSGFHFWLDVHESNECARKLYRSLGFEKTGLRKGYYRDGGACIQMTLNQKKSI